MGRVVQKNGVIFRQNSNGKLISDIYIKTRYGTFDSVIADNITDLTNKIKGKQLIISTIYGNVAVIAPSTIKVSD